MLPIMMSARPLLTDWTVGGPSILGDLTPGPILAAIVAMISASEPISLPSSIAIIGISLLFAIVSTPGSTVLKAGATAKALRLEAMSALTPMPTTNSRREN